MTEFNELEKKKSQFLSRIKKRLERMCVHTRHAHTHTPPKILVVKQSHLPPPSLNKIRNQLSFSIYQVQHGKSGWHWSLSNTEQTNALHLRNLYPKKGMFIHIPFPLGEYQPQRKPSPVCISCLQILLEFLFGLQPLERLAFPRECEVYLHQSLRCDRTLNIRIPCLGPSTCLLHLKFPLQNFKIISRH